jgi:hypothetical protein
MTRALWAMAALLGCRSKDAIDLDPEITSSVPPEVDPREHLEVQDIAIESGVQTGALFGHFGHGRACAIADVDTDGWADLIIGHPTEETFVMRNVTAKAGDTPRFELATVLVDGPLTWALGPADYDNDGDIDIFVSVGGIEDWGDNHLFRNMLVETGSLSFTEVTAAAGVVSAQLNDGSFHASPNAGATMADIDRDGDTDLFVSQDVYPMRSYDRLEPNDPRGYDLLFRNNGDGTFTNVREEAGLDTQEPTRHSFFFDMDNDGDQDLFENNFTKFNYLWRNRLVEDGVFSFEDITGRASLAGADLRYPLETFAASTEDFNNDGWQDILVFQRGWPTQGGALEGHTLYLNTGAGFVDATRASNLNNPFDPGVARNHAALGAMGCVPADLTGDGLVDVYIGNGGPELGWPSYLHVAQELVDVLFEGVGTVQVPYYANYTELIDFPAPEDPEAIAAGAVYPPYPYRGHGPCAGDFNNDGKIELFVTYGGAQAWGGDAVREPDRLFSFTPRVETRWLHVRPFGDGVRVSRDAIGTRVKAVVLDAEGNERAQYGTLRGGSGFSSVNLFSIYLGLADAAEIVSLEVTWPDGEVVVMRDVALDQVLEVHR